MKYVYRRFGQSLSVASVAAAMLLPSISTAAMYDSITVFGDSLSDGGYFQPALGGSPLVGKFTTNPDAVWSQALAARLDLPLVSNIGYINQAGNNYAVGGARAGIDGVANSLPVASVASQIDEHLARQSVDANGLHVVWVGANDLFFAAQLVEQGDLPAAQASIGEAIASSTQSVAKLHQAGAQYILVPNIPDIGLTPDYVNGDKQSFATMTAQMYNQMLYGNLKATGANIIPLDTFGLLQQVAANPSAYGFDNMTKKACQNSSLFCHAATLTNEARQEQHFFADGVHPTGRAHQMIADYAYAVASTPNQVAQLPKRVTQAQFELLDRLDVHIDSNRRVVADKPYRVWATMSAGDGEVLNDSRLLITGVDIGVGAAANTGFYANQQRHDIDLSDTLSFDMTATGLGAYYYTPIGDSKMTAYMGVGLDRLKVQSTRQLILADWQSAHHASSTGKRVYAHAKLGYPLDWHNTNIMPYASVVASRLNIGALNEQESLATAMVFEEQKYKSSYGSLGVRWAYNMPNHQPMQLFGDIYYRKQLSDGRQAMRAGLKSINQIRFEVPVPSLDDDALGVSLGVRTHFGDMLVGVSAHHIAADDDYTGFGIEFSRAF